MPQKPTMSEKTPPTAVEILNRFYATERIYMSAPPDKRDFTGMAATLSPTMTLHQSPDLPYGGTYSGHEGFLNWSQEMAERFDVVDVQNPRVLEGGGDEVVVLSELKLRVRRTAEEWLKPFAQVVKVDRAQGAITEIRPFYWDVKGLNDVLGK